MSVKRAFLFRPYKLSQRSTRDLSKVLRHLAQYTEQGCDQGATKKKAPGEPFSNKQIIGPLEYLHTWVKTLSGGIDARLVRIQASGERGGRPWRFMATQFSLGGSMWSTTQYTIGPMPFVSRSPNWSCKFVISSAAPSLPNPMEGVSDKPGASTALQCTSNS